MCHKCDEKAAQGIVMEPFNFDDTVSNVADGLRAAIDRDIIKALNRRGIDPKNLTAADFFDGGKIDLLAREVSKFIPRVGYKTQEMK
jgi:hypothetical protein